MVLRLLNLPDDIYVMVDTNLERVLRRIRVHLGDSVVVHIGVDGQLLNPGRHEEATGVLADDLELQHAVHEGNPVVDPGKAAARAFDVAADNTTEEATGRIKKNFI